MQLGAFRRLTEALPPDTPVIFYRAGTAPLPPDTYCDGLRVGEDVLWEGAVQRPCVLVELGEAF